MIFCQYVLTVHSNTHSKLQSYAVVVVFILISLEQIGSEKQSSAPVMASFAIF